MAEDSEEEVLFFHIILIDHLGTIMLATAVLQIKIEIGFIQDDTLKYITV